MNRIPKLPGVYIIRNLVNGKEYVGQATNLWARWQKHKQEFANGTHDNPHLVNSWRKYGKENFEFIPLVICERAELTRYEQGILDRRKCAYNICRVAVQSCLGVRHSLEARAHMSAAQKKLAGIQSRRMKELWASPEYRASHRGPGFGRPTDEQRAHILATIQSPEYREKQRTVQLARWANRTPEEKLAWGAKMSAAIRAAAQKRGGFHKAWTAEQLAVYSRLYTNPEIGEGLSMTPGAIRGRAYRAAMAISPEAIRAREGHKEALVAKRTARRVAKSADRAKAKLAKHQKTIENQRRAAHSARRLEYMRKYRQDHYVPKEKRPKLSAEVLAKRARVRSRAYYRRLRNGHPEKLREYYRTYRQRQREALLVKGSTPYQERREENWARQAARGATRQWNKYLAMSPQQRVGVSAGHLGLRREWCKEQERLERRMY